MGRTTVSVSDEVADELHGRKQRGESYDDVLRRLLDMETDEEAEQTARESGIDTPTPTPDVDRDRLAEALPGSGEVLEARVDAIADMYALLREEGAAKKSDLLDAIDVEATGYASPASVWANMVKGRDTLAGCPGVEAPSSGMSTWEYKPENE